ncbi:putative coiled coil protein [Cryptosporidium felis]|nr:putative coiled coil protein [Cryptosporidium felis]
MQFNYDNPLNGFSDEPVEFESELAKLGEETSLLYKDEYVKDFIENYHVENKQSRENKKSSKQDSQINPNTGKNRAPQPYSYDIQPGEKEEANGPLNREKGRHRKNDKNHRIKSVHKNRHATHGLEQNNLAVSANKGGELNVFSRKYGSQDEGLGTRFVSLNINEVRGDVVKSSRSKENPNTRSVPKDSKKCPENQGSKQTRLKIKRTLIPSSSSSEENLETDNYESSLEDQKKQHFSNHDEKIKYYLDQSSFDEDNNSDDENEEKKNGLTISNKFLSELPTNNKIQEINQLYEQNERDMLMKRIRSLEVIESSQKMLILETQNREQQYRIRSEELQKQLEYKDTKLLLLNQDYENLKRDFNLLTDEKEMLKKKYSEMEGHWNEEYSQLYRYKMDYEIVSKHNETLLTEKNSFINLIEEDKERYRKMEINNTTLSFTVENLEKRNHEIVERCSKLQEEKDSLSREYNKLYHKYTALLSDYSASKKNSENLNSKMVELEDLNKRLTIESTDIREKYKTLADTERALEQLQDSNTGLLGQISSLKEERDILSAEYKILEKKFKAGEESSYEMKNQILDFTLENQKLKKLIKQTIIPLIPDAEYNSTIGHILTVLNAKENSRMSTKVLEEEYLNNVNENKPKTKEELSSEVSKIWKGIESPFSPKKLVHLNSGGLPRVDYHKNTKFELSPKADVNLEKLGFEINDTSPEKVYSNLRKFERMALRSPNSREELKTGPTTLLKDTNDNERVVPTSFKGSQVFDKGEKKSNSEFKSVDDKEDFKRGVSVVTPRPYTLNDENDHSVPILLPKKLESNIRSALENDDVIPVIPELHTSKDNFTDSGALEVCGSKQENQWEGTKKENERIEATETQTGGGETSNVADSIRMVDNYEKQILLLNVEKLQLEAELATLPGENWSKNAKERENRTYLERRILEIQNSIVKASSSIKSIKEKQLINN